MNEWKEYSKKCKSCGNRFVYRKLNLKTKKSYVQNHFHFYNECNRCFTKGLSILNIDEWKEE